MTVEVVKGVPPAGSAAHGMSSVGGIMSSDRGAAWAVGLALFTWFAATAWIRPLMLPDEGRYVGVALEMLRSGNWAVPTLDGLPFFHKPPLFYWITAAAMGLLGEHPWTARLASMLAATAAALALYLFVRRWRSGHEAAVAVLVLAAQPFFFGGAQFAGLDMLVAGCITLTVLLSAHAVLLAAEARPHRLPLFAAYGMAALGVLAKGLIAVVLPTLVFIVWLLATRRPALILKLISLPGLLLFALIAAPWFVTMQQRFPEFLHYFFLHHHFQRFAQTGFNNARSFWFYVPVMLVLTLPWSLGLWRAWQVRPEAPTRPGVAALMWSWIGVVVVFFSLPQSKLIGYVLPAVPPLAALIAATLCAPQGAWLGQRLRPLAAVAVVVCVVIVVVVALFDRSNDAEVVQALRAQRRPGEPVLSLRHYPYALRFNAKLDVDVPVVAEWNDPERNDNWRRELAEAGRFDPARASQRLLSQEAAQALMCGHERNWLVTTKTPPPWPGAVRIAQARSGTLWQLSRNSLDCSPRDASPAKS